MIKSLWLSIGCILSLQWWPKLPEWHVISVTAVIAVGVLCSPWRRWSLPLFVLVWTASHGLEYRQSQQLLDRLGDDITIQGTVTSLFLPSFEMMPRKYTILVRIERLNEKIVTTLRPHYVTLYLEQTMATIPKAGQQWRFQARVRPVSGRLNAGGFDRERWAVGRKIVGQGRVIQAQQLTSHVDWRQQLAEPLGRQFALWPQGDLMLALVLGERGMLSQARWQALKQSGLVHLVAISGLHIGFALMIGWQIGALGRRLWSSRWTQWWPLYVGGFFALGYAALAGFSVPTLRAILMASLVMVSYRFHWRIAPWLLFTLALLICLLIDPFSSFDGGLWLSFGAVAALYVAATWWRAPVCQSVWRGALLRLGRIQGALFVLMLPMQWLIFHGFSWSSPFNNALAIPWMAIVVAPVIMLVVGLLPYLLLVGRLPSGLLQLFDGLLWPISGLSQWHDAWIGLPAQGWSTLILLTLLLFSLYFVGVTRLWQCHRVWCAGGLVAIALSVQMTEKGWQLIMLDVGHGLAMALVQGSHAVLYDTGTAWQGGDIGQSVILPWLQAKRLTLEGVIISHDDRDHRGGLAALQQAWPHIWLRDSRQDNPLGCQMGDHWYWRSLKFTVLWPPERNHHPGNSQSCVLLVDDGHYQVLLTGDLDAASEYRLLSYWQSHGLDLAQVDIMQVPHHGSRSGSTRRFIQQTSPTIALNSAARYSPWPLPHPQVLRRYQTQGVTWCNTAETGQVALHFQSDQIRIVKAREQPWPVWYRIPFGPHRGNE